MSDNPKSWKTYEEVAEYLLNKMADQFGLLTVERKQKIRGQLSGTSYIIDAKGVAKDGEGTIIIECRRYTMSKLKQENIAALAYRIIDTGAKGGIIVSPLGLQEGATKIAQSENIVSVQLNENSTTKNYILRFLNKVFVGITDMIQVSDNVTIISIIAK